MSSNAERDFFIPNNNDCGIPRNAAAYAINVTVVPGGPFGFLTIWPSGQERPNVSALNSDGRIKAGGVIVPAGTDGGVSVYVTDAAHIILDITGYFSAGPGLVFYPLTPCRVADTRNGAGDLGGPPPTGGAPGRSIPVLLSSCGIPASAQAYALNFTALPQNTLGYLTVWPSGQPQPLVSTLNAPAGAITANGAIVPAGAAGNISVYATDNTDLIVDVSGYFAPPDTGGLSLYTMTPCRVLDTRDSSGTFSGTLDVGLNRNCIIPYAARAYSLTATVLPTTGLGYLTLWANGQSRPLAAIDGAITSNIAIVPSINAVIDAYATDNTHLILDIASYFAP